MRDPLAAPLSLPDRPRAVLELMREHDRYRAGTLNLIASENIISPAVAAALQGDLEGRYADYTGTDLLARKYRGGQHIVELEELCTQLARQVFGADACELRPISGHVAGNAVLAGLCEPGDLVLEVGQEGGGHRLAAKLAQAPLVDLRVSFLPFDAAAFNVDARAAAETIVGSRPRVVVLGSSTFLHPHPVSAVRAACDAVGATLAYDASHVMGLLAAGRFQDPTREGAHLVFGSTHKTLFGPQGGIIFGDTELVERSAAALYPPLITNHHPLRIPALALALYEHLEFGEQYADAVIANARAFAAGLVDRGHPVAGGGTDSHAVLLVTPSEPGADVALRLERAGIITNASRLPVELGGEGVRFGLQEFTRRGGDLTDAARAADLVSDAIAGSDVARAVRELSTRLDDVSYTWGAE